MSSEATFAEISCPATDALGEILWHLLKASQLVDEERKKGTDIGREVDRDEIHWWVFNKEDDLGRLESRTREGLDAAQTLKTDFSTGRKISPTSQSKMLGSLREFAESHQADIEKILEYLRWLRTRDPLAPSIMFTYRVWGTTRRGDRKVPLAANDVHGESQKIKCRLAETALGLWTRGGATWKTGLFDYLDDLECEVSRHEQVDKAELARRVWWRVSSEFLESLEMLRDSLRNILLDIEKCKKLRELRYSDAFWRRFVTAVSSPSKEESQLWDFKETLGIWRVSKNKQEKERAKTKFAEHIASFANADGGVTIVGVSDSREIVGIKSKDFESELKFAKDVLATRIKYPRDLVSFHHLEVSDGSGAIARCLVIMVAKASDVVGVCDGNVSYTYPIRRETGLARVAPGVIESAKAHLKSDSYDFIDGHLMQVVRNAECE